MIALRSQRLKQIGLAGVVLASRFVGLAPNVSPVGSYGFLGGSPVFFFATIVLFDLIKGGLYPGFIFTYLGFLAYAVLGSWAGSRFKQQLLFLPLASFLFFLISNLGVWWYWHPQTVEGLIRCYTLAIPFYKNTLLGDIVFGYTAITLLQRQKIVNTISDLIIHAKTQIGISIK